MPSPGRHSMTLGSAVTVTVSPASVTVSSSTVGPGSSQNQETAPVSPVGLGRCPNPAGQERQPIGDRGGKHSGVDGRCARADERVAGRERAGCVWAGTTRPGGVPEAARAERLGVLGEGRVLSERRIRIGAVDVSRTPRPPHFPVTARRLLPTPHRGADTGPGSVVLLRVAADRDDGRPGFAGRLPHVRCGARGERERGDGAEDDQRGSG